MKRKRAKSNRKRNDKEVDYEMKRQRTHDTPSDIHPLTFRRLVIGMTLLGVVKDVHDLELIISLPNNLTGAVSIAEISSNLKQRVESVAAKEDESDDDEMEVDEVCPFDRMRIQLIKKISCCLAGSPGFK